MMGVDFLQKAAPSFRKGRDKARQEMYTPDLFRVQPELTPPTYAASFEKGAKPRQGEALSMRLEGDEVVLRRGIQLIGKLDRPTPELRHALKLSFNEGAGMVHEVHRLSNRAEITAC